MKKIIVMMPVLIMTVLLLYVTGCQKEDAASGISAPNSSIVKNNGDFTISCECTYTPGYWKTHPEDPQWGQLAGGLGVNTVLFGTGWTYLEALWMQPRGSAYIILAHAWIAARLNASYTDPTILAAYNHGAHLLSQYDGAPYPMGAITKAVREDFINTAAILDDYNNGIIGPGHCPD